MGLLDVLEWQKQHEGHAQICPEVHLGSRVAKCLDCGLSLLFITRDDYEPADWA
jgi:hypothetical protein